MNPIAPPHPLLSAGRLAAALGASLALHTAALALVSGAPRGGDFALRVGDTARAGFLHATLRDTPPEQSFSRSVAQPRLQPEARRAAAAPAPSALAGIGAAAPQQYYPTRELDEKPLVTEHVEPRFPEGAPVGGRVVVRLYINRSGTVDRVEVLAADPAGLFDGEAIRAFAASRFLPGKKAGIPVNASMDIEALFGAPIPAQSVELQSRPPEEPRRPPPYVPRGAPSTSRR